MTDSVSSNQSVEWQDVIIKRRVPITGEEAVEEAREAFRQASCLQETCFAGLSFQFDCESGLIPPEEADKIIQKFSEKYQTYLDNSKDFIAGLKAHSEKHSGAVQPPNYNGYGLCG